MKPIIANGVKATKSWYKRHGVIMYRVTVTTPKRTYSAKADHIFELHFLKHTFQILQSWDLGDEHCYHTNCTVTIKYGTPSDIPNDPELLPYLKKCLLQVQGVDKLCVSLICPLLWLRTQSAVEAMGGFVLGTTWYSKEYLTHLVRLKRSVEVTELMMETHTLTVGENGIGIEQIIPCPSILVKDKGEFSYMLNSFVVALKQLEPGVKAVLEQQFPDSIIFT